MILIAPSKAEFYTADRMTVRSEDALRLYREALRLKPALRSQVVEIMAQATINANDSMEEKTGRTWDYLFTNTCASWTCERECSKAARKWFNKRGIVG